MTQPNRLTRFLGTNNAQGRMITMKTNKTLLITCTLLLSLLFTGVNGVYAAVTQNPTAWENIKSLAKDTGSFIDGLGTVKTAYEIAGLLGLISTPNDDAKFAEIKAAMEQAAIQIDWKVTK